MVDQADFTDLDALRAEFEILSNAPYIPDLDRIGWVFRAYTANANALIQHIRYPHEDPNLVNQMRMPGENPQLYIEYQSELLRQMRNYCATAAVLIEHSRQMMGKLAATNPEVVANYERHKAKVVELPVAHFIKDLRNYMIHYSLPSTGSSVSYTAEDNQVTLDIFLSSSELLKWSKWTQQSKAYRLCP